MKRVVLATVATVVGLIMLLSFKTRPLPADVATRPAALSDPPSTASSRGGAGASTTTTARGGGASTTAPAGSTTYTGDPAQTRYGPVQVEIKVANGQVADVEAVAYPTTSPRDRQINAWAIPELNQEAVAAKTAKIDLLSGATYTSDGYVTSLQSALDKAGLS